MHRHNIVPWILIILTVRTFSLAAPVLVQEKHRSCVDEVDIPRDVITALEERALDDDLHVLYDGPWRFGNVWGEPSENEPLSDEEEEHVQEVHAPPPNQAQVQAPEVDAPPLNLPFLHVPEGHAPPPNLAGAHVPLAEVHFPLYEPPESDSESMVFDDDAPPGSPQSGHSHSSSRPISPNWPTESEHWYTPPSSPRAESY
jgi:hypothetical protein